jgi:hypothetical protein
MEETESIYPTQSEFSLKRRNIPVHPKGFNNDWGAIMQHQAEVQQLLDDEQTYQ